jgi:HAD superfamily hydrolase (TIGR01509 family)
MLDFDGPVCTVFGDLPASHVAARLRRLIRCEGVPVPAEVDASSDPFEVLRYAARVDEFLAVHVETELCAWEVRAARSARPTPHVREVIEECVRDGLSVCIVSNNSRDAVWQYVSEHGLAHLLGPVVGRSQPDPALLKPSPYLILQALRQLGARPGECVLVGDSAVDMQSAQEAGVHSVGYANRPGKDKVLAAAGADVIITSMTELPACLAS